MKNKKIKRNKSKRALIVGLALLLVVLSAVAYTSFIKGDSAEVSQEDQKTAEQADVALAKDRVEEEAQDEPLKEGTEDEGSVVSGLVALSSPTFSQSGGLVNSSVYVSGAESGTRTLIFTDGDGRAISEASKLVSGGCSISVSEAEFTMIGEYNLTVKFGDKSVSKTVNIK